MATRRAASCGPVANPFWSERAVQELEIRSARPVDLPVPTGDEAELDQAIQEDGPGNGRGQGESLIGKGTSAGRRWTGRGERFSTPVSWEKGKATPLAEGGAQTEGEMPEEVPTATEGEMPGEEQSPTPFSQSAAQDGLQRELEKEVVAQLHQENMRLKLEMEEMKKRQNNVRSGDTTSS